MIRGALLTGCALLALSPAAAQNEELGEPAVYPAIAAVAASAAGFAPKGWTVETSAQGDLNGDRQPDLAFVLHGTDPAKIVRHEGLGENPLDTNPRMLVVALRDPSGYRRVLADTALIPRRQIPTFDDPLGEMAIRKGTLRVRLGSWASAGSWEVSSRAYTFRMEDGAFRLIGLDMGEMKRNTGETKDTSINFLTGRVKNATGSIEHDAQKVSWSTLAGRRVVRLADVGDGLDFDPFGGGAGPR